MVLRIFHVAQQQTYQRFILTITHFRHFVSLLTAYLLPPQQVRQCTTQVKEKSFLFRLTVTQMRRRGAQ